MNHQLVYPLFAMFLLTFAVGVHMFLVRVRAVKSGAIKTSYFHLYDQNGGPEKMIQASRHFSNLFETPVLFYTVCILGILSTQGFLFVVLAWMYVAARAVHALIHLGSNRLKSRMRIYGVSWLILLALWGLLVSNQMMANPGL